jgi:hypothetical protein
MARKRIRPCNNAVNNQTDTTKQKPASLITPPEMAPPTEQEILNATAHNVSPSVTPPKESIFGRFIKAVQPEHERLMLFVRIGKGEGINLSENEQLYLGRGEGCEIMVDSLGVSRQHARIAVRNGVVTIEDLDSRNGTYVNGKRIDKAVKLSAGDLISLGKSVVIEVRREK